MSHECERPRRCAALLRGEEGATAVEYATLLGLLIVMLMAAITSASNAMIGVFENIAGLVQGWA